MRELIYSYSLMYKEKLTKINSEIDVEIFGLSVWFY